jgi:penicillin-binding protein 1A
VREVITVDIAREMMMLLVAVVQHGTGAAASSMNHALGGKTGTTNDYTDAWFLGFSPSITAGTWVGFDDRRSLGEKETGARAALPIWMDFMKVALADRPNEQFSRANAPKRKLEVAITPPGQEAPAPTADKGDEADDNPAPPPPPPQNAVPPAVPANGAAPNDEPAPAPGPQLPAPKRPTVVPRDEQQQN